MTHPDFVFPQHGDEPDAAYFAYWLGQADLTGFVDDGFDLTTDFEDNTLDISSGKAFILRDEMDTASPDVPDETFEETFFVVGKAAEYDIELESDTQNLVYLDPRFGHTDSPRFRVYEEESEAPDNALQIARVNTAETRADARNRGHPLVANTSPLAGPTRRKLRPDENLVIEEDESMIVLDYFDEGTGDLTIQGDLLIIDQ